MSEAGNRPVSAARPAAFQSIPQPPYVARSGDEFRKDTDFVVDNLTGVETLEYSLDSGAEGGITEPAYLRQVEAFAEWFRKQPEVSHVQAFPTS